MAELSRSPERTVTRAARAQAVPAEEEIHFGVILRALRRNWLLIAGCVVITLALAAVYSVVATPVYEASARIRVDEKQPNLPEVVTRVSESDEIPIHTELLVLRSRSLAAAVVDSLQLQFRVTEPRRIPRSSLFTDLAVSRSAEGKYRLERSPDGRFLLKNAARGIQVVSPGQRAQVDGVSFVLSPAARGYDQIAFEVEPFAEAVEKLEGDVRIDRAGNQANIINLRYRDPDPQLVRDVLNAWIALYVARRRQDQVLEVANTAEPLQRQLDTLSVQLRTAEEALTTFREREEVIAPEVQAQTLVRRLAEAQAERSQLAAEREALSELMSRVRNAAPAEGPREPSPYRRLLGFPALLRNQTAAELLRSLAQAEEQRAELLTRRTLEDPDVQVVTARIRDLEEQIRAIAATYLQALNDQMASLETTIHETRERLRRLPVAEVELARLQRDPEVLREVVTLLQTRLAEAQVAQAAEDVSVRVVDPAVLPREPVKPKPALNLLLGLFLGLLLGGGAAFVREKLDRAVYTPGEVEQATRLPVLGTIPSFRVTDRQGPRPAGKPTLISRIRRRFGKEGQTVATTAAAEFVVKDPKLVVSMEAYARLYLNSTAADPAKPPRTLLVTSALPGDGKTTTATNLAITLALRGHNVLLIDGDLRRGIIHELRGTPPAPGLTEVLDGRAGLPEALRSVGFRNGESLSLLTAGAPRPERAKLLDGHRLRALLHQLERQFDLILLDSPPLNLVTDAAVMSRYVDGVLLVARAGKTSGDALAFAAEQLRSVRAPVLGAVLTDAEIREDILPRDRYDYFRTEARYRPSSRQREVSPAKPIR